MRQAFFPLGSQKRRCVFTSTCNRVSTGAGQDDNEVTGQSSGGLWTLPILLCVGHDLFSIHFPPQLSDRLDQFEDSVTLVAGEGGGRGVHKKIGQ